MTRLIPLASLSIPDHRQNRGEHPFRDRISDINPVWTDLNHCSGRERRFRPLNCRSCRSWLSIFPRRYLTKDGKRRHDLRVDFPNLVHLAMRRSWESQFRVVLQDIFADLLLPMKELTPVNSFPCTEFGFGKATGCGLLNNLGPLLHSDAHDGFIQLKSPPREYGFLLIHSTQESDSIIDTDYLTVTEYSLCWRL